MNDGCKYSRYHLELLVRATLDSAQAAALPLAAARAGEGRHCPPRSVSPGSAEGGVFPYGIRPDSGAHHYADENMGRDIQKQTDAAYAGRRVSRTSASFTGLRLYIRSCLF